MSMLDVLKERLPEGLTVKSVKDRSSASTFQVVFSFEGQEMIGHLPKTCAPGMQDRVCDRTIYNAMISIALDRDDLDMAHDWLTCTSAFGRTKEETSHE